MYSVPNCSSTSTNSCTCHDGAIHRSGEEITAAADNQDVPCSVARPYGLNANIDNPKPSKTSQRLFLISQLTKLIWLQGFLQFLEVFAGSEMGLVMHIVPIPPLPVDNCIEG